MMRKSSAFFKLSGGLLSILVLLWVHATLSTRGATTVLGEKQALVAQLGLTDLCLFTEARYTRHLSQADLNTPFQDHPLSLEHFPSGSFMAPPSSLESRP